MNTIFRSSLFLLVMMLFNLQSLAQNTGKSSAEEILSNYFEAYNHHNIDSSMRFIAKDFRMYSVTDTTQLDIDGKSDLRKWLQNYFKNLPNVSSEFSAVNISDKWVSFIETAHWGEGKSASSLAVYEIVDNKIHRVWYYY